jgi:hypothetical protein
MSDENPLERLFVEDDDDRPDEVVVDELTTMDAEVFVERLELLAEAAEAVSTLTRDLERLRLTGLSDSDARDLIYGRNTSLRKRDGHGYRPGGVAVIASDSQPDASGEVRTGPTPADDRPPRPRTVMGDECPGCRSYQVPVRWYDVVGGTLRGEALDVDADDRIRICSWCENRLRDWLNVDESPEGAE